jgi:hypothetical protein
MRRGLQVMGAGVNPAVGRPPRCAEWPTPVKRAAGSTGEAIAGFDAGPADVLVQVGAWDTPDRTTFRVWFSVRAFERTVPEDLQRYLLFYHDCADLGEVVAFLGAKFLGPEAVHRPFDGCGAPTLDEVGKVIEADAAEPR